jgi:hypothetical protein
MMRSCGSAQPRSTANARRATVLRSVLVRRLTARRPTPRTTCRRFQFTSIGKEDSWRPKSSFGDAARSGSGRHTLRPDKSRRLPRQSGNRLQTTAEADSAGLAKLKEVLAKYEQIPEALGKEMRPPTGAAFYGRPRCTTTVSPCVSAALASSAWPKVLSFLTFASSLAALESVLATSSCC